METSIDLRIFGEELRLKDIDRLGWAAVTGYSIVKHKRASNVWNNLVREVRGLGMNEEYGVDPYFKFFARKEGDGLNL